MSGLSDILGGFAQGALLAKEQDYQKKRELADKISFEDAVHQRRMELETYRGQLDMAGRVFTQASLDARQAKDLEFKGDLADQRAALDIHLSDKVTERMTEIEDMRNERLDKQEAQRVTKETKEAAARTGATRVTQMLADVNKVLGLGGGDDGPRSVAGELQGGGGGNRGVKSVGQALSLLNDAINNTDDEATKARLEKMYVEIAAWDDWVNKRHFVNAEDVNFRFDNGWAKFDLSPIGDATNTSTAPNAAPGAPKKITSEEEFKQLPSGTQFIAPDGSIRTKP